MSTRKKKEADSVSVDRRTVEKILEFYEKCLRANHFFDVCQAPSYRRFIANALSEAEVSKAFENLAGASAESTLVEEQPEIQFESQNA